METLNQTKALQQKLTSEMAAYQQTAQLTSPVSPCPPDVERFIREALAKRKPSLIPFATTSPTVATMVKYLKRHCSQSHSTAYLYTWSVQQYCRWCGADPDQRIAECFAEDSLPNQKALLLEVRRLDDYVGAL